MQLSVRTYAQRRDTKIARNKTTRGLARALRNNLQYSNYFMQRTKKQPYQNHTGYSFPQVSSDMHKEEREGGEGDLAYG